MITKTVEILDRATFIPALAVKMESTNEADRYLLGRAGFGTTPPAQARYIYLVRIAGGNGQATCDPTDWTSGTMRRAHEWLNGHFDEIESGAVVDVEYIAGVTSAPKPSERVGEDASERARRVAKVTS